MWIAAAILSAVFAGITAILSKIGLKNINSDFATAIRTSVVLILAWGIVLITGAYAGLDKITDKSWIFLILSGLATGASWICYFKALSIGEVSKVAAVDKSSTVLSVLFAIIIFPDERKLWWVKLICLAAIAAGTYLMADKITVKSWIFLILSGFATAASWLCYYYAIQQGQVSVVVPIDKLSILITVFFSLIVFREKLSSKSWTGLALLTLGTLCMAIFT